MLKRTGMIQADAIMTDDHIDLSGQIFRVSEVETKDDHTTLKLYSTANDVNLASLTVPKDQPLTVYNQYG